MKTLEWSMTIPKDQQQDFIKWFNQEAKNLFTKFGIARHELLKTSNKSVIDKQNIEDDQFVERMYFDDNFDIATFFMRVDNDEAGKLALKAKTDRFKASDMKVRVLLEA